MSFLHWYQSQRGDRVKPIAISITRNGRETMGVIVGEKVWSNYDSHSTHIPEGEPRVTGRGGVFRYTQVNNADYTLKTRETSQEMRSFLEEFVHNLPPSYQGEVRWKV